MSSTPAQTEEDHGFKVKDTLIALIIFTLSLIATLVVYTYEKNRIFERDQARFELSARIVEDDIINTMTAYSLVLASGVALFNVDNGIDRQGWQTFIQSLKLSDNYPAIQGISYNGFVKNQSQKDALVSRLRAGDWPEFEIKPSGEREFYAPVVFLDPLNDRNQRAIGFDIYSEANRRETVKNAIETGNPSLTAKITLVQENADEGTDEVQAGALLILPIFDESLAGDTLQARQKKTTGLIVSVFRIGDLVTSILDQKSESQKGFLHVKLFDSARADPDALLYQSDEKALSGTFRYERSLDLFGRQWLLQTTSTAKFESSVASISHLTLLGAGILLSLLLTSLAWSQVVRTQESRRTTAILSASNTRIEYLMGEVNHRSKNLLNVVQAIANRTAKGNPDNFAQSFSRRLTALAASQDLLVRGEWQRVSLKELVTSQLSHFGNFVGTRILVDGPEIYLRAETAQTLGMAIHELSTNATKHGALTVDEGVVSIRWRILGRENGMQVFEMSWVERQGPPAAQPAHTGFGTTVSQTMVKYELSGEIETSFTQDGFEWHLTCPLETVAFPSSLIDISK